MVERYVLPKLKVEQVMTKKVIAIDKDASIEELVKHFRKYDYHGFPVLSGEKLVGMVTKTDILKILGREKLGDVLASHISDIMTTPPSTISPDVYIGDAVKIMLEQHIRTLPVVKNDRLVGFISNSDVVRRTLKRVD
ncbi:MAG: CBS domain-containing protein [Methanocellales archaeon]|nr:CBS domain-containing protein [Methanocellales archaeon]